MPMPKRSAASSVAENCMGWLSEAALAPPVRLLVDGRLVLLLLILVGGMAELSALLVGIVLLAVPGNLILLLRWGRGGAGRPLVLGTRFAAWDGIIAGSVLVVAAMAPGDHLVQRPSASPTLPSVTWTWRTRGSARAGAPGAPVPGRPGRPALG